MRLLAILLGLSAVAVSACGQSAEGQSPPAATHPGAATHPRVTPQRGHRHTMFVLSFTLPRAAGIKGVTRASYRVVVRSPKPSHPRCQARPVAPITSGRARTRRRVKLRPSAQGWCLGRYAATVYLESGPYCPKPEPGERPRPCPLFATREMPIGTAHFRVVR